ncbi:hypothetical protein IFR05_003007 [Cadophora sp. M221]|nr:hypothetical protein IFR05_003007 [Cadophora sp. M221]
MSTPSAGAVKMATIEKELAVNKWVSASLEKDAEVRNAEANAPHETQRRREEVSVKKICNESLENLDKHVADLQARIEQVRQRNRLQESRRLTMENDKQTQEEQIKDLALDITYLKVIKFSNEEGFRKMTLSPGFPRLVHEKLVLVAWGDIMMNAIPRLDTDENSDGESGGKGELAISAMKTRSCSLMGLGKQKVKSMIEGYQKNIETYQKRLEILASVTPKQNAKILELAAELQPKLTPRHETK